ncbi:hypothetical protein POTOM_041909 [Populus tomentosa]|uniref:cysteine dioxygenase n=1 Tax=Populus tomentosa TaxID=118781 RepID=A0A8X8CGI3_POPTO|nr:hypothetical protein POTOM_041909 [Populus tomentosa]
MSDSSLCASLFSLLVLCFCTDTVGPADVGLREENRDDDRGHGFLGPNRLTRVARWAQSITYLDIYECDSFTMCIFCFPTSSIIPLHDHPSMTVFSKVLYGSLHVKAYDWVEPSRYQESKGPGYPSGAFTKICQYVCCMFGSCFALVWVTKSKIVSLAKLTVDKVLTAPCGTSVLFPKSGGNLHCFTAITPCAVLDILTPPYREDAGRKCTYYHDYPYSTSFEACEIHIGFLFNHATKLNSFLTYHPAAIGNGAELSDEKIDDHAWLAEVETPDLYMRQGAYTGPTVKGTFDHFARDFAPDLQLVPKCSLFCSAAERVLLC